jgi:hypothetical protein
MAYLKTLNSKQIALFLSLNMALFWGVLVFRAFDMEAVEAGWRKVTSLDTVLMAALPLLAVVGLGLVGSHIKAVLVFLRPRFPLPGCRAFSKLAPGDPRIDLAVIARAYGEPPSDPMNQNRLWYKLFRQHEDNERVTDAHRLYLLTRDMTALSAVFLIAFGLGAAIWGCPAKVTWMYLAFLILQYGAVSTAARNYGNRFATTVLAEVTAKLAGGHRQHVDSPSASASNDDPQRGGPS